MNRVDFKRGLSAHFGLNELADIPAYADIDHWGKTGEYILDIFKFDNFLHAKFGNYEERGLSAKDVVTEEYGEAAAEWCMEN